MTALEIINALQKTRSSASPALLWIHHGKRKAAFHDGVNGAIDVDYDAAYVARGEPALNIICMKDGETLCG